MAGFHLNGTYPREEENDPDPWREAEPHESHFQRFPPPTPQPMPWGPGFPPRQPAMPPIEQNRVVQDVGGTTLFMAGLMVGLFGAIALFSQRNSESPGWPPQSGTDRMPPRL